MKLSQITLPPLVYHMPPRGLAKARICIVIFHKIGVWGGSWVRWPSDGPRGGVPLCVRLFVKGNYIHDYQPLPPCHPLSPPATPPITTRHPPPDPPRSPPVTAPIPEVTPSHRQPPRTPKRPRNSVFHITGFSIRGIKNGPNSPASFSIRGIKNRPNPA